MSSDQSIPLQVIYNRLEPRSVSHYSMVDLESEQESVHLNEVNNEKKKTKYVMRPMHPCARFCVCMWFLFIISGLVLTIASLLVGYYQLQGCTASENYNFRELITELKNVKEINFKVVTGTVLIDTHESDQLIVKMYSSARETEYLENMEADMYVEDGVLVIRAESPAFEFESCQYNHIEVLLPNDVEIQVASPISITGHVIAGYVGTGFLSNVDTMNVKVDLGLIEIEAINANSIQAHTGLGLINAVGIWAQDMTELSVGTGSVYASSISSSEFIAKAHYGATYNRDISADKATAHTTFGYSTLLRPNHFTAGTHQEISVSAHYGKAIASSEQIYDMEFQLGNMKGDVTMKYESFECELESETDNSLQGTCALELLDTATSEISVSVCYGNVLYLQNQPRLDSESLALSPDAADVEIPQYERV